MHRVAFLAAATVVLSGLAVLGVAVWTPPAHAVRTPGATPVDARFAAGWVLARGAPPRPSTSLEGFRCEVWKTLSVNPCPDAARMAAEFWPSLAQSPDTIYVALSRNGYAFGNLGGVNVEHDPARATLLIHGYLARPLWVINLPGPQGAPDARAQPGIPLLLVSTTGIGPGTIKVVEDGWIERVTGDEPNGETQLGTVAIS